MVNVLWTGIFLIFPISFAHDDRRIKRAVFDIIPKHDYQDQTVRNSKDSIQKKTVRRVSIPVKTEENNIQQKSEQIKKLDLKVKAIELDQEKINDEHLLLNLRGRGSKFKTDNSVKIFCFLTTLFVFSTTIVQLKIY